MRSWCPLHQLEKESCHRRHNNEQIRPGDVFTKSERWLFCQELWAEVKSGTENCLGAGPIPAS